MPHQEPLTVIARVDPAQLAALESTMAEMRADPGHNAVLPFARVPGCHFGRVVLLPASEDLDGRPIAAELIMLSDCDGSALAHLQALVDVAGSGLDRLFGACEGYPRSAVTRADRLAFLRRNSVAIDAHYVHRQGRAVEQIIGEAELREALQRLLATESFEDVPAVEVQKRLRALLEHAGLRWALEPPPPISLRWRARNALDATTLPLLLLVAGPVVVPAALVVLVLIRLQEQRDASDQARPTPEHVRALYELEDAFAQNGFTAGGYVKRGPLRQAVVKAVLPLIGWGTRHLFTRDSLAGVKTIHFARWIPLDGGRRVVFASNYDGSLESYNNDFIDLVSWGLNLVFSNGLGYPRTRWLVHGGATREQEFKDYLRRHQIPTPVWWSAYPKLTALNIERNAKLRAGLRARMNEREARQWLRLV